MNGQQGSSSSKHGADGAECRVPVPLGTLVRCAESGDLLADISEPEMEIVIAKGGRGGFGNEHFKTATNQTPRNATPGGDCQERTLLMELKLIADVGLLGMPNAGKSTLLAAVSRARPKIADYPFTTLTPQPGIAELPGDRRIVIADIPGLIKGAASGAGLGLEFLRHVERTHLLVHLIDSMAQRWRRSRGALRSDSQRAHGVRCRPHHEAGASGHQQDRPGCKGRSRRVPCVVR